MKQSILLLVSVKDNIIVCGGRNTRGEALTSVEILGESNLKLPPLPSPIMHPTMVVRNNDELLVLSGYGNHQNSGNTFLKFSNGSWIRQLPYKSKICWPISLQMSSGTFMTGLLNDYDQINFRFQSSGHDKYKEYEQWLKEPEIILSGSTFYGVPISNTVVLLTGGTNTESPTQIIKYDIESHEYLEFGSLLIGRLNHQSILYQGKVIVTGGERRRIGENHYSGMLRSTEIIDLSNGVSRRVGDLNEARTLHGMGILKINGNSKLVVFGGETIDDNGDVIALDSVEEWDDESESWKISSLKLSTARSI